jgi:HPt (histidine-containing phosphotransfer) domain-containing protein
MSAQGDVRPEEALARLEGMRDVYEDVVGSFLRDDDGFVGRLRAAVAAGDGREAGRVGHTLKGLAGMCGAVSAAEAAATIERTAPTATPEQLVSLHDRFQAEMEAAREAFRRFGITTA